MHECDIPEIIERYESIGGNHMLISACHLNDAKQCL